MKKKAVNRCGEFMEISWTEPGEIHKLEELALDQEIRNEILELIGADLKTLQELQEKLELKEKDLRNHLSILEKALLVERDENGNCYKLTPRCIAYLDECEGYEWRR